MFFWLVFTLRKVAVYVLVNSFKLSKMSKFSEVNFIIMFFFWFNIEGGFMNLMKTEFLAHYFIYLIKNVYVAVKEEIQDEEDDEDDSIGLGRKMKAGAEKLKQGKTKPE